MSHTITCGAAHLSGTEAYVEVTEARDIGETISDSAALTVASHWQSPGTIGRHLAALASGAPVSVGNLLDDIAATRAEAVGTGCLAPEDDRALTALASWVQNRPDTTNDTDRREALETAYGRGMESGYNAANYQDAYGRDETTQGVAQRRAEQEYSSDDALAGEWLSGFERGVSAYAEEQNDVGYL